MKNQLEPALDNVLLKPLVEAALVEDLGRRGDVTSQATIPADKQAITDSSAASGGDLRYGFGKIIFRAD